MKYLSLLIFLVLNLKTLSAARLEIISEHNLEFINMALVNQTIALNDGRYIVQKYGKTLSLFNEHGKIIREIEFPRKQKIYHKGLQLNDGSLLFITDKSEIFIFSQDLEITANYYLPLRHPYSPCQLDNGLLAYRAWGDKNIFVYNGNELAYTIKTAAFAEDKAYCFQNKFVNFAKSDILEVFELTHQGSHKVASMELKGVLTNSIVFNDKYLRFLRANTKYELNIEAIQLKKDMGTYNQNEANATQYFKDGSYITSRYIKYEDKYISILELHDKTGKLIREIEYKNSGAQAKMPFTILKDKYVLSPHCYGRVSLYDRNLNLLDELPSAYMSCTAFIELDNGRVILSGIQQEEEDSASHLQGLKHQSVLLQILE